jgi:hypothetical protein
MNVGYNSTYNPYGCTIVTFTPYYYLASTAAAFQPGWEQASENCSTSPIPIGCYSGIGTVIIPSFPLYGGIYYDVAQSTTFTATGTSANANSRYSDRWTVNDLSEDGELNGATNTEATNIAFTGGVDGYVANSMQDYKFVCNDAYMQPVYTFKMEIQKINVTGTTPAANLPADKTTNQFPDWSGGSWDQ